MIKQGILITIEGIDGSGKSTLAAKLHQLLEQAQLPTVLTREPGATPLGQSVRAIVQEKKVARCDKAEYLFFAADRAQHFSECIIPNLQNKKIIISDRMADSSLVYQGYGRGLDIDMIQTINRWVMQDIEPHITFYVRIPATVAFERIAKRNAALTAFEQEKNEFFQKLVDGFDTIFQNKKNGMILDGTETADSLAQAAYNMVIQWIQNKQLLS